MTGRLKEICSRLEKTGVFADIGCDHGYCTQYMLEKGLCGKAYISDISRGSLRKAEVLLAEHIRAGRCVPVCADGLEGLPEPCDLVLIAGMGGEEIVRILARGIPPRFVLQPMKNSEKVRAFLVERGCRIDADYTFADGKFYDLIVGENAGGGNYTEWEILFGRDNLLSPSKAFRAKIADEIGKVRGYLQSKTGREAREALLARYTALEEIENAFEPDL
ncbi:MAG: tRNA (adenine(22)-N(1))-methyltransferase [Candidatus Gallimonas sp.]